MTSDLRCNGPHPTVPYWVCRAPLNVAVPTGYEVRTSGGGPRCLRVTCWQCGRVYLVCPVRAA